MKRLAVILFIILITGQVVLSEEMEDKTGKEPPARFNDNSHFEKAKSNSMVAYLIGNNEYTSGADADYLPLNFCRNDTVIMERILNKCCSVPAENIHRYNDITRDRFLSVLAEITRGLKQNQSFFFYYSGHGDKDGALVFKEGQKILPRELKRIMNSFPNDTIVMLDSCYSGYNEGPLEMIEELEFKKNCIRLYSSLAHSRSKEIEFSLEYFSLITPFLRNVLELTDVRGSGYFTALFILFFAEYRLKTSENISYYDIFTYISNKGKQYSEHLYAGSKSSIPLQIMSQEREKQQPKIYPMDRKAEWKDPNHQYLILFNPLQPRVGILPEISVSPVYYLSGSFKNNWGVAVSLKVAYAPGEERNFSIGIETGYLSLVRPVDEERHLRGVVVNIIPVMVMLDYQKKMSDAFSFHIDGGAGILPGIWYFERYLTVEPVFETYLHFGLQGGIGFDYSPRKEVNLALDVQFWDMILTMDNHVAGIKIPFSFSYRF